MTKFHDTWSLIGYAAARTERIHLSANVTSLPMRPPAVLARSVATLDLLSGGRIALGIGAGAFWDGIEAMGGRRLTPGQSIAALEEAITIIRGIWDADQRGGLTVGGEYYRVRGAKRGPTPAHQPRIWVGAYKPRILRMTGHAADGWLPSVQYLPGGVDDLTELNRHIDDGAHAAGRVRRLLNITGQFTSAGNGFLQGPPSRWVEQLTEVALTHGTSAYLLASDDTATTELFAAGVAPAVRELVGAGRRG